MELPKGTDKELASGSSNLLAFPHPLAVLPFLHAYLYKFDF